MYTCIYIYIYRYIHVYIYTYIYIYYIYVYVYVYIHIYIYIHICTHTPSKIESSRVEPPPWCCTTLTICDMYIHIFIYLYIYIYVNIMLYDIIVCYITLYVSRLSDFQTGRDRNLIAFEEGARTNVCYRVLAVWCIYLWLSLSLSIYIYIQRDVRFWLRGHGVLNTFSSGIGPAHILRNPRD